MGSVNEWVPTPKYFNRRINEVEAVKLVPDNVDQVSVWCGGRVYEETPSFGTIFKNPPLIEIPSLDGAVEVFDGEWIVHLENGQFEKMSEAQFKKVFTYANTSNNDVNNPKEGSWLNNQTN